jgi:hypothetical protein
LPHIFSGSTIPILHFLQLKFVERQKHNMRYESLEQKDRVKGRRRHDVYEAYSSSDFHTRRGRKHHDQQGVINMLDTFTNLCVGDYPAGARNMRDTQDKRKDKYVLYPIARYPDDRLVGSRQVITQPRRKRIKQHFFRPVSEDEKPVSNYHRGRW